MLTPPSLSLTLSLSFPQGIYQTMRKQVVVNEMGLAPLKRAPETRDDSSSSSSEEEDRQRLKRQQQMVWKTVNVYDDKGMEKRTESPLEQHVRAACFELRL